MAVLIGLHFTARGRGNLRIADFAVVFRIFIQQRFIGEEPLRQPFGVIQTLHGEDVFDVL